MVPSLFLARIRHMTKEFIARLVRKCKFALIKMKHLKICRSCDNGWQTEGWQAKMRKPFWHGRRWLMWVAGVLLATVAIVAGVVLTLLYRAEPFLRACIVQELKEHFHARVELDSFHMSLAGGLWVEGKGLRIWPPAQADGVSVPGATGAPLIRLAEFRFRTPLHYAPSKPIRISVVELKGLNVDMPPRSHFGHGVMGMAGNSGSSATVHNDGPVIAAARLLRFQVENVTCNGAHLTVETSKPGKLPLEFAIAHLKLTHVSKNEAMGFEAELTNPRPIGTIHSTGRFGPWLVEDPGESAVYGDYRFDHADLGGFKSIAGILSSTGHYEGTLRHLVADGETETPDFRLSSFDQPLALHTKFHARIDGTNGDTWLEPVEAILGHSHFTAEGQIVRVVVSEAGEPPHSVGHDIALKVNVDRGRMEDFIRLASHSDTPLLTGVLTMKAKVHIPPGPIPVHERLRVAGTFDLEDARFASPKIQERIGELSLRGLGRPKDAKGNGGAETRSAMEGDFQMGGGVVTLPRLKYTVPGAVIDLKGTYGMEGGALKFAGTAKMQAPLSQIVGGWKGLLLKPADRFFRKDGAGTEVQIHIEGTREKPEFGIGSGQTKDGSDKKQ